MEIKMGMRQYVIDCKITTSELIAVARSANIRDGSIFFPVELLRNGTLISFNWDSFIEDMCEASKYLEYPVNVTMRGDGQVIVYKFDNGDVTV